MTARIASGTKLSEVQMDVEIEDEVENDDLLIVEIRVVGLKCIYTYI